MTGSIETPLTLARIATLGALTIVPPLLEFPAVVNVGHGPQDISSLLIAIVAAFVVTVLALAIVRPVLRQIIIGYLGWTSIISILTTILLRADELLLQADLPGFFVPTPQILAPLLRLDGELAYDAGMFEAYCVLWLCLAALLLVALRLRDIRRDRREDSIL